MFLARLKFLVVALVALLQCFVPLIHAHAHETPGQYHVHIHADEFNTAPLTASAIIEINAPADASPAIGVAQEFKRDGFLLPILGLIVLAFLVTVVAARIVFRLREQRTFIRIRFRSRPPATAPPCRAA